jgi:hypothetical protein
MRWGVFQEGRFLGKVQDEWIADSREFVRTKLPKLIVIAMIAFLFSHLLRVRNLYCGESEVRTLSRRPEMQVPIRLRPGMPGLR